MLASVIQEHSNELLTESRQQRMRRAYNEEDCVRQIAFSERRRREDRMLFSLAGLKVVLEREKERKNHCLHFSSENLSPPLLASPLRQTRTVEKTALHAVAKQRDPGSRSNRTAIDRAAERRRVSLVRAHARGDPLFSATQNYCSRGVQ